MQINQLGSNKGHTFLGIDPGSVYTGYAVLHCQQNGNIAYIDSGRISCGRADFSQRLCILYAELKKVIQTHSPDFCAIEELFVHKNPMSALKLGHARGVALLLCAQLTPNPVVSIPARQIKQALTGFGGAGKEQIQYMVRAILRLEFTPSTDEADALAIAWVLCEQQRRVRQLKGVT